MTIKIKYFFILLLPVIIICSGLFFTLGCNNIKSIIFSKVNPKPFVPAKCTNCETYFYDGVYAHEKAYRKEGIQPQKSFEDIEKLHKKGVLVELKENELFFISDLEHSRPYLLKKACTFLNELGMRYKENCDKNALEYKRFKISSITRSVQSVKNLRKVNSVAIKDSPHLRGKTFDISYAHFGEYKAQLTQFIKALNEARKEGKCYVKYEQSTGCLHITAI
jgi:hypothetical protein